MRQSQMEGHSTKYLGHQGIENSLFFQHLPVRVSCRQASWRSLNNQATKQLSLEMI